MARFLLRRLAASLLLLFLLLTVVFFLLHLVPGDPTHIYDDTRLTREQRETLRRIYGLDRPLLEQYGHWLGGVVRGDLGVSLDERRPAAAVAAEALPATLLLASTAVLFEYGGGLLLGVMAARRRGGTTDRLIRIVSLLLYSQPTFWLGLMAILLFSYLWPVLPASHMHSVGAEQMGPFARLLDLGRHLVLPAMVMGLAEAGARAPIVRASLIEAMSRDYIRTARAKGLSERRVVWVHGLRTAVIPLVQLLGVSLPLLLSGALITEVVFSWPGLGRLAYTAIQTRDYPLVLCTTAFSGAMVVAGSFAADIALAALDPRVRAD